MKVYIKLLGTYSKYLPADAQAFAYGIDAPAGIRVEALRAQLPLPAGEGEVVLINGRTPHPGQVLEESDTVAIFPAMAGG